MGLEFSVNEYVLIPRQDTETLVEQVLKDFQGKNPEVLDLCTGSGCIGISLSILGGWQEVTLADISLKALLVAKRMREDLMTANASHQAFVGRSEGKPLEMEAYPNCRAWKTKRRAYRILRW